MPKPQAASMVQLYDKKFKPFITKEAINSAVLKMAEKIQSDYEGMNPVFIGVLNGSFLIVADLVREFTWDCEVSFVKMASYEGTNTTGVVNELIGLNHSIENRHVVIIEDIVDSGNTVEKLVELIGEDNPASLKIATLLYKPKAYQKQIPIDYVAIEVGNEFLVGYGLDYDGLGRNLKDIYIITE